LKFPTWGEFITAVSRIEKDISEKVQQFKQDHPLLNKAIKASISYIPPPLNAIAQQIYDSFEGDPEDKSEAVLNYFKYLQSQGEQHYNKIAQQLDTVLVKIEDVKSITAKESTVQALRELLISIGDTTNLKIDHLANEIGIVNEKIDSVIHSLGGALKIVDKISVQMDTMLGKQPQPYSVQAFTQEDKIVMKDGEQVRTITAEELETKLDPQSRALIRSFEESMQNQFMIWTKVYPKRNSSPDPLINAQIQLQLKEVGKIMCTDWKQILQYLGELKFRLDDHYIQVQYLCDQLESLV
jgi:hypothetical protein